jgi:RNA polymerase sigma-70 factor (ECF subfamily)
MLGRTNGAVAGPQSKVQTDSTVFPTTRWSRVRAAGESVAEGREAFEKLCRDYWQPLFAYLHRRGFSQADAEDLTQGFFLHLLEHHTTRRAEAERGRFRSFLLGALKNYIANEAQRAGRQKRGGDCEIFSLDDPRLAFPEPSCESEASSLYEESWAQEVIHHALERLRQKFAGREELFDALEGFLDGADNGPSLDETATVLGLTPGALRTAVSRLRKQFAEELRLEIARTVSAPHEVEEEFQCLRVALIAGH